MEGTTLIPIEVIYFIGLIDFFTVILGCHWFSVVQWYTHRKIRRPFYFFWLVGRRPRINCHEHDVDNRSSRNGLRALGLWHFDVHSY